LFAENDDGPYIAYVSEQNLLIDDTGSPVSHPQIDDIFVGLEGGKYLMRIDQVH